MFTLENSGVSCSVMEKVSIPFSVKAGYLLADASWLVCLSCCSCCCHCLGDESQAVCFWGWVRASQSLHQSHLASSIQHLCLQLGQVGTFAVPWGRAGRLCQCSGGCSGEAADAWGVTGSSFLESSLCCSSFSWPRVFERDLAQL